MLFEWDKAGILEFLKNNQIMTSCCIHIYVHKLPRTWNEQLIAHGLNMRIPLHFSLFSKKKNYVRMKTHSAAFLDAA